MFKLLAFRAHELSRKLVFDHCQTANKSIHTHTIAFRDLESGWQLSCSCNRLVDAIVLLMSSLDRDSSLNQITFYYKQFHLRWGCTLSPCCPCPGHHVDKT